MQDLAVEHIESSSAQLHHELPQFQQVLHQRVSQGPHYQDHRVQPLGGPEVPLLLP